MGNGITELKLAMTDDNIPVIIKTLNGPEGSLVLFNEYVSIGWPCFLILQ
jgi:hypothetical protein